MTRSTFTHEQKTNQNEKKTQDIFGACFTLAEVKRHSKMVFFYFLK